MSDLKKMMYTIFRIAGWSLIIISPFLLILVVADLLFFQMEPWVPASNPMGYLLLNRSDYWIQKFYHQHYYIQPRGDANIWWHTSWAFSLLGLKLLSTFKRQSVEKYHNAPIPLENVEPIPEKGKLSLEALRKYIINIQLFLTAIGAVVVGIKGPNFSVLLIILVPLSILPQYFLAKMISRRSFQKIKYNSNSDILIFHLLILGLGISYTFTFGYFP